MTQTQQNPSRWARAQRALQPPEPRVFAAARPAYERPDTRAVRGIVDGLRALTRPPRKARHVPAQFAYDHIEISRLDHHALQAFRALRRAWRGVLRHGAYVGGLDRKVRRLFAWLREVST